MRPSLSFLPFAALFAVGAPLVGQSTTLVSATAAGIPANGHSYTPSLSDNGRFVVFSSKATDLAEGDVSNAYEPFEADLKTGQIVRVALNDEGSPASASAFGWGSSSDGRYVVFESGALNLVPEDLNGVTDVFVRDTKKGLTTRVSVATDGTEGDGVSDVARISGNGRFVVFSSSATTLVADDSNGVGDVFLHDRKTGVTERISVDSAGTQADGVSFRPTVSSNGRWVAFVSLASNLVPNDTNGLIDAFVRDRKTGLTTRVSESAAGGQATGTNGSVAAFLSGNGRFVAIASDGPELVPGDTNALIDLFVRDLKQGTIERLSVGPAGEQANGASCATMDSLWISGNGRWVAFASAATNLVAADTNGSTLDVFLRDRKQQTTVEADIAFDGSQAVGGAAECAVGNSGRRVAFSSVGANLTPEAAQGPINSNDIFVRDLHK